MEKINKSTIVIIGASFSGLNILFSLISSCSSSFSLFDNNLPFKVILIDSKDYFEYYPSLPVCFNLNNVQNNFKQNYKINNHLFSSLEAIIKPYGEFIHGVCLSISANNKLIQVKLNNNNNNNNLIEISYDALILCSGVPYSFPIKSNITNIEKRQENLFRLTKNLANKKTITILGGGLIGVELAAELCHNNNNNSNNNNKTKITIITSDESLLPTLPKSAGLKAYSWFLKKDVNIIFKHKVKQIVSKELNETFIDNDSIISDVITNYQIETIEGDVYYSDYIFNCTGNLSLTPNQQYDILKTSNEVETEECFVTKNQIPYSKITSKRGTILVNSSLQPIDGPLSNHEGIFVCGDLADIASSNHKNHKNSNQQELFLSLIKLPDWALHLGKDIKSGFIAELQSEIVSKNILLYLKSLSLNKSQNNNQLSLIVEYKIFPNDKLFTPTVPLIACVSLGPSNGIMVFNNIVLGGSGIIGYLCSKVKLFIEISQIAKLKNKLWARLFWYLADYLVTISHFVWILMICSFSKKV